MNTRNEICTLDYIIYCNTGDYFGFQCQFTTDDGRVFGTGDTYIANTSAATPFTKAYVFDKMAYCIKKTGCYDLEKIRNRKVRVTYDNGSFLGFWFVEDK
jgi:hypothetical protein